jgi:hypothetical protein
MSSVMKDGVVGTIDIKLFTFHCIVFLPPANHPAMIDSDNSKFWS